MANYVFVEDNGTDNCTSAGCSGRSDAGTVARVPAAVGGSATLGLIAFSVATSTSNVVFATITCPVPDTDTKLDAQTVTVNIRLPGAPTGTLTWTETHICRVDSGCANPVSCGALTGQSTSLNAAAQFSHAVTIPASVSGNATDLLYIQLVGTNSSSMSAAAGSLSFNPETSITVSFSAPSAKAGALPTMGVG